jgi:cytochrome P450
MNDESFAVPGDPDAVQSVLNGSPENFEKGEFYDMLEAAFGKSILTVDDPEWSGLHAVLTPLFSRSRIASLLPFVTTVIERHLEQWDGLAKAGEPIDLLTSTKRLAFDIVSGGLLGIPNDGNADRLFDLLHRADRTEAVRLRFLGKRVPAISNHFRPNPLYDEIDRVAFAIAHERIGAANQPDDLIGGAIASPFFQGLSDERKPRFIRDLVASILSAGYVTTGDGLFWSLRLLASHSEAQERLHREAIAGGSRPWLSAVISESLRLYPPVWFLGRIACRPVEVGGMRFDAGTRFICSPYVLHRMPALWPAPDEFRPERFLPGAAIAPKSYIPFGSGMRACIGRALALMELSALIPAALLRFQFALAADNPATLAGTFSLQPRELVYMRIQPR